MLRHTPRNVPPQGTLGPGVPSADAIRLAAVRSSAHNRPSPHNIHLVTSSEAYRVIYFFAAEFAVESHSDGADALAPCAVPRWGGIHRLWAEERDAVGDLCVG